MPDTSTDHSCPHPWATRSAGSPAAAGRTWTSAAAASAGPGSSPPVGFERVCGSAHPNNRQRPMPDKPSQHLHDQIRLHPRIRLTGQPALAPYRQDQVVRPHQPGRTPRPRRPPGQGRRRRGAGRRGCRWPAAGVVRTWLIGPGSALLGPISGLDREVISDRRVQGAAGTCHVARTSLFGRGIGMEIRNGESGPSRHDPVGSPGPGTGGRCGRTRQRISTARATTASPVPFVPTTSPAGAAPLATATASGQSGVPGGWSACPGD